MKTNTLPISCTCNSFYYNRNWLPVRHYFKSNYEQQEHVYNAKLGGTLVNVWRGEKVIEAVEDHERSSLVNKTLGRFLYEVDILCRVTFPGIAQIIGVERRSQVDVLFEYLPICLTDLFASPQPLFLQPLFLIRIVSSIARALLFLSAHTPPFPFVGLCPEIVYFTPDWEAQLVLRPSALVKGMAYIPRACVIMFHVASLQCCALLFSFLFSLRPFSSSDS